MHARAWRAHPGGRVGVGVGVLPPHPSPVSRFPPSLPYLTRPYAALPTRVPSRSLLHRDATSPQAELALTLRRMEHPYGSGYSLSSHLHLRAFAVSTSGSKPSDDSASSTPLQPSPPKPPKSVGERAREWKDWIVEGAKHYWHGSVLLVKNTRSSFGLIGKIINGQTLARRERLELITTAADLFRLVPFMVFVIVPFMEFLLPFALKLFPNMLPSTFAGALKKEDDLRRHLKLKLNMASFLQDTLKEMSKKTDNQTQQFVEFMNTVGALQSVNHAQLRKYAIIFQDNFSALSAAQQRPLLIATCKFLRLNTYGNNTYIKWQIRMALNRIKRDDKLIRHEGIKTLTFEELRQACTDRGMIATGVSKAILREQMEEWLDLAVAASEEELTMLLLSRAMIRERKESEAEATEPEPAEDKKLLEVADAVSVLSSENALQREREELEKLKLDKKKMEEAEREKELARISKPIDKKSDEKPKEKEKEEEKEKAKGEAAKKRLGERLESVLSELEKEFSEAELEVGHKLKIIDKDSDGIITTQEITDAIELLRTRPSEAEIVDVLRKLDLDQDGKIALKDVEQVLSKAVKEKHQRLADRQQSTK